VNGRHVLNARVETGKQVTLGSMALGAFAGLTVGSALCGLAGGLLAPLAFAGGGIYGLVRGFKVNGRELFQSAPQDSGPQVPAFDNAEGTIRKSG